MVWENQWNKGTNCIIITGRLKVSIMKFCISLINIGHKSFASCRETVLSWIIFSIQKWYKTSWEIMKNIINKNIAPTFQSAFRLKNGPIISDRKTVSQHFNDFFINFGPNLARNISNVGKLPKDFLAQMVEESLHRCVRQMILCILTITDQCHFWLYCQRSLRG